MKSVILLAVLALAGCASTCNITTKTVPIAVPIMYSPAPPVVARPVLPTDSLTATSADGDVAKAYAADVQALLGYSLELESIVAQYKTISDKNANVAAQAAANWKAKTGDTLVIPAQTTTVTVPAPATTK